MPTRTVKSIAQVYSFVVIQKPFNLAPVIEKIEGYFGGAANAWLQWHDGITPPANGTVPFREVQIFATDGFLWQYATDNLKIEPGTLTTGLILCVSTTQGALTLGTVANKASFMVSMEQWEQPPDSFSTAGDMTTAVSSLVVWNDSVYRSLYKVVVSSAAVVPTYLQLFTAVPVSGTTVPIAQWTIPASQGLMELSFGAGLTKPVFSYAVQNNVVPGAGTGFPHNCYLYESTTPGVFTAPGATDFTIQAYYK